MSAKAKDPDRIRHDFWKRNRWCAPKFFVWEDGWTHYDYVVGYHPSRIGPVVWAALERLWGGDKGTCNPSQYLDYMTKRMPKDDLELVASQLKGLKMCEDVVGDCTFENILVNGDRVYFIDPGHPRGLKCRELDLAKALQSMRGWEHIKRPKVFAPREPDHFGMYTLPTVALYITHMYRLLKHDHPKHCLEWARREIQDAKENLLHRLGRDVASQEDASRPTVG